MIAGCENGPGCQGCREEQATLMRVAVRRRREMQAGGFITIHVNEPPNVERIVERLDSRSVRETMRTLRGS